MKMRILVILGLLMGFASTGSAAPKEDVARVVDSFYAQYYKEILRKSPRGISDQAVIRWVMSNSYLSDAFKKAFRKMIMDARKKDPELGLDMDPIVDGNDYPDKGYRAKEIRIAGDKAYVAMEVNDDPNFTRERPLPVELVKINNKWKINGIGIINRSQR
jgi:hypothetical protein